jgi:PAS domain S-box-containing protein
MSKDAKVLLADADAVLRSAEIGRWCYEIDCDQFYADALVRELLDLDPDAKCFPWEGMVARVHPRFSKQLRALIDSTDDVDRLRSLSVEVRTGGRETRHVTLRASSSYDDDGRRRVHGVLFDDTYRSRLHEDLRRSEERFRMLAYGIPNAFFFLNEDLCVEFANDEFARPLGKTVLQILGRHIRDVFGQKMFAAHEHYLYGALAGKRFEYEARVKSLQGEERFLRILDRPAFDVHGNIRGVFSESTEITAMKRLEKEARASEARFRAVAEGVPNFLLFLNRDLRVEFCNDHFLQNSKWTRESAHGLHISEILGPQRYAQRREFYERALVGETLTYESGGAVGNDSGYFRFNYQPSYDEDGEIRGVFSTATDISKRRRAELALEKKQAELTRSNQDLEQFAYVASHDLKAPLRAINLLVQWIRADLEGHDVGSTQENLELLEQRTQRLGRLLDDLLAYSRVGRKVGEHAMTDCNALVRDVIQLAAAPEHISISIETQLPVLVTYATPLEQVFRNLIGNAIKHHPGPKGTIEIAHEETEEFYVFSVQDDGEGIPQEYADRVFQMFQTLKPRDEVEGSGMGLAIVSRIVGWQGGRVWFEPVEGGTGTVFKCQGQQFPQQTDAGRTSEVRQWQTAKQ